MKAELLKAMSAALTEGPDGSCTINAPCGVFVHVPGDVVQRWKETPATPEVVEAANKFQVAMGGKPLAKEKAGTIWEIIIGLLPQVLPLILPILIQSLTPKNGPVCP